MLGRIALRLFSSFTQIVSPFFGILCRESILFNGQETNHPLIATEIYFELINHSRVGFEFQKGVKPGRVVLDGVVHHAQSPHLLFEDLGPNFKKEVVLFSNRFLHLCIRQNGSQNENGFVIVHAKKINEYVK